MSIYALKVLLFQNEYIISENHVHSLNIFCKFIFKILC